MLNVFLDCFIHNYDEKSLFLISIIVLKYDIFVLMVASTKGESGARRVTLEPCER